MQSLYNYCIYLFISKLDQDIFLPHDTDIHLKIMITGTQTLITSSITTLRPLPEPKVWQAKSPGPGHPRLWLWDLPLYHLLVLQVSLVRSYLEICSVQHLSCINNFHSGKISNRCFNIYRKLSLRLFAFI